MLNTFTYDRAKGYSAEIVERGLCESVSVVQIHGAVGGRTNNPELTWGYAVRYTHPDNGLCVAFWPGTDFRDPVRSHYIVDGVGMYVAGWRGLNGTADVDPEGYVLLHPISEHNHGMLPRRAYVLRTNLRGDEA